MTAVWIALVALLGTGMTGAVTWAIARRATSGRIETTEAASLWTESANIRTELRLEAKELRERIGTLQSEVRDCHGESLELKKRLATLEAASRG